MDIRDFNPIDPDIAKGKGKGKSKPADKGKDKGKKGQGKGQGKLKGKKNVHPPLLLPYMPQQPKGKARNSSTPHPPSHYLLRDPACHCGRSRLTFSPSSPLHLLTHMAQLVIVADSAFQPTSSIHFPPTFIPNHQSFPPLRPGLSLWQIPPLSHLPTSFLFIQFFDPAYHCGRSRLPHFHYLPSTSPCLSLLRPPIPSHHRPGLSLWQVPPPPFTPSPSLFPFPLSPPPLPSLSSCRPARAGCHGRSKAILLTLFQLRSTSDLTGFPALREVPVAPDCLAVPRLLVPCHYDGLRRLAVLRFYVFGGGHGSLLRPCRVLPAVQDHLSGF